MINSIKFDFNDLFILDMANNHQGSVEHGKRIIKAFTSVTKEAGVRAVVKFQFRHLDTFIHPDFMNSTDNKHIPRFLSTRLSEEQYAELLREAKKAGFIIGTTIFDEESAEMAKRLDVEILKVGSCSAKDWPLLEKIVDIGKPIVCSTAGLSIDEVDDLASFFNKRMVNFALMHCVAIYPTPKDKLNLQRIADFKKRYPDIVIGFSTHENPDNLEIVKMAYAKGARIFERHIGVPTEKIKLNAYSSTPEQLKVWLDSYKEAVVMDGAGKDFIQEKSEIDSLKSLMRGVYAKNDIFRGNKIKNEDIFFAMPLQEGQLSSGVIKKGNWRGGLFAEKNYKAGEPISALVLPAELSERETIYKAIHKVKGMLGEAGIVPGYESSVEISHHYGLKNFFQIGAFIITCINKEYCKKLIVLLPGQEHPYHYHKKKEETFQVLSGILMVNIERGERVIYPGDLLLMPRGVWHGFFSEKGAIFEEISTAQFNDDSFYADNNINKMAKNERKTELTNWGRHQFD